MTEKTPVGKRRYVAPSLVKYGPLFVETNACSPNFYNPDSGNDKCDPDGKKGSGYGAIVSPGFNDGF